MKHLLPCAIVLALGACQTSTDPGPLHGAGTDTLACRGQSSLAALRAAGAGFQRAADAELASGRCRLFPAGQMVDTAPAAGHIGFVDPASGVRFWIYHPA